MKKKASKKTAKLKPAAIAAEASALYDSAGKVISKIVRPAKLEFKLKDFMQVVVGATLLAVPLCYTEEVWNLGAALPLRNVIGIGLLSVFFVALFVYYKIYQKYFKTHYLTFFKRVLSIYVVSFGLVALLLTLIQQAPWAVDHMVAIKRVIIAGLPASMSAAVADML